VTGDPLPKRILMSADRGLCQGGTSAPFLGAAGTGREDRDLESHARRLRRRLDSAHARYVVRCWGGRLPGLSTDVTKGGRRLLISAARRTTRHHGIGACPRRRSLPERTTSHRHIKRGPGPDRKTHRDARRTQGSTRKGTGPPQGLPPLAKSRVGHRNPAAGLPEPEARAIENFGSTPPRNSVGCRLSGEWHLTFWSRDRAREMPPQRSNTPVPEVAGLPDTAAASALRSELCGRVGCRPR
jgi:hypothetical protein